MSVQVLVKDKCHVYAYNNGKLTAKAQRGDDSSMWIIGKMIDDRWSIVGSIEKHLPEVLQRKLVQAMLQVLA